MIIIEQISPTVDVDAPVKAELVIRVYDDTFLPVVDLINLNIYQVTPNPIAAMLGGEFVNNWSGEIITNTESVDYTIVVIPPNEYGSGVRVHFLIDYEEL